MQSIALIILSALAFAKAGLAPTVIATQPIIAHSVPAVVPAYATTYKTYTAPVAVTKIAAPTVVHAPLYTKVVPTAYASSYSYRAPPAKLIATPVVHKVVTPVVSAPVVHKVVTPVVSAPVVHKVVTPVVSAPVVHKVVTPVVSAPVVHRVVSPVIATPVVAAPVVHKVVSPVISTPVVTAPLVHKVVSPVKVISSPIIHHVPSTVLVH